MLSIRSMHAADLPALRNLKNQAGWNQTDADLHRFLALEPAGCFLAEDEGRPLGSATAFLFDSVAWIAMVLVDKDFRGRGIGKALMKQALEFADQHARGVRLDATPLGRPLYETLGFALQFRVLRFAGTLGKSPQAEPTHPYDDLVDLTSEQLGLLVDYDRSVTRTNRGKLLSRLHAENGARAVIHQERCLGYAMTRPGANATQIGPCLAEPGVGVRLLGDAFARHAGASVHVDIPADHAVGCQLAASAGLAVQRELFRMTRGEPILEDVDRLWASSGPEKG